MTPFTTNYETMNKDKAVDIIQPSGNMTTPNQGKIQSTFLQTVRSNKFFVALIVAVLGTGLVAYNNNPVPSSNQTHLGDYAAIVDGSKGGGITGTGNGGITGDGIRCIDCEMGVSRRPD